MPRPPLAAALAATLALLAAPAAAHPPEEALAAQMTKAGAWIAANGDLPPPATLPDLKRVSPRALEVIRLGGHDPAAGIEALYDDATATIYLRAGWTGTTPAEMSILVHEMVHHLQAEAGRTYPCPGAREAEAYALQETWLAGHGSSLAAAFGIDAMTLLVRTTCAF